MDAFVWGVIGSVAGIVGAAAAIVFGLIPLLRERKEGNEIPPVLGLTGGVAEALRSDEAPVVVGEIPQEPVAFQSRAGLLAGPENAALPGRIVVVRAVTGMRGVGKTHLAAEFARARLADRWRLVAWINSEDADEMLAGLAEVSAALGLQTADREASGRAVRHWLETGGQQCLLVFDNACDPAALRPFIPAGGAAEVIITSNEHSMDSLGTGVPLEVFTEQEGLAFLAERTRSADTEGARTVAAELGYLPLALAQAAAVIVGQRLEYGTYLGRLSALPVGELLRPEEAGQYPRGVAAAVLLSVEAIRIGDYNETAVGVMELLAVLSAAGVHRSIIYAAGRCGVLGKEGQAADVADRALARLAGASLLTFSVDGSTVAAHRLVMRVIREEAAARDALAGICIAAGGLLDELASSLERSWHRDRAAVRDLVEQIMSLYSASAACQDDTGLARLLIQLRSRAAWFLNQLGDSTSQAIGVAHLLLADQERVLGSDHPDTMKTRRSLAAAYRDAGRTDDAIALHEETLADCERVLGSDHPDTMATRNDLAIALLDAGCTDEAIALHEQALAERERVLGSDHPDTMRTRDNLAIDYQEVGRTAEAIVLHEQALADCERVLGSDHPDTMKTRGNLALSYRSAGRTDEAIALHEEALTDCERVLGSDHPDTMKTRHNLAVTYQTARRRRLILLHRTSNGLPRSQQDGRRLPDGTDLHGLSATCNKDPRQARTSESSRRPCRDDCAGDDAARNAGERRTMGGLRIDGTAWPTRTSNTRANEPIRRWRCTAT